MNKNPIKVRQEFFARYLPTHIEFRQARRDWRRGYPFFGKLQVDGEWCVNPFTLARHAPRVLFHLPRVPRRRNWPVRATCVIAATETKWSTKMRDLDLKDIIIMMR